MDEEEGNPLGKTGEMVPQTTAQMSPELRKRRSTRIVQAVPLVVTGVDALGRAFQERTSTLIINCHGCRYQSKHYVLKNMWVTLEIPHPETGQAPRNVRGRVAWIQRPRTVRQLFQVAIELEVPGNAWGIAFPPEDWFAMAGMGETLLPLPAPEGTAMLAAEGSEAQAEIELPAEGPAENVHVFPAPTGTDASLQLARQAARLLAEAKQQIQAAAGDAAKRAVSEEQAPAIKEWEARFAAAREELSAEVTRSMDLLRLESDARARASQTAAETLQQELPKWLAPQLEQLTHELTEQLVREASANRATHEELVRNAGEILGGARQAAEESAERLRATASQQEALLNARAEAAGRALDEAARQRGEAVAAAHESLARAAEEHRQQLAAAFTAAEASWQQKFASSLDTAQAQLRAGIESSLAGGAEKGVHALSEQLRAAQDQVREETGRQISAVREAAAAARREAEAQVNSLRKGLNADVGRVQEALGQIHASSERLEQFSAHLEDAQKSALESFQSRLDELAGLHRSELQHRSESLVEELNARMRSVFEDAGRDAAARFEEQLRNVVQPHIARADEAVHRLAGGRSLLDAAVTLQQDRIRGTTEEAFESALARFREHLDAAQREFHESAQSVVAKNAAELEARASELKHTAAEELYKTAEWYEKKAQTQLQHLAEKGVEQAGLQLRERAGEISSVFATELDGHSRNFVEHAQGQLEEAVRESFDRARGLFAEAADTTSAAFTDEIQRQAREELDGFGNELSKSMEELRVQADGLRRELGAHLTAEQENFLYRFQSAMTTVVESGVGDAQKQVRAGLEPLLESWRSMTQEHQAKMRELYQKMGDHSVDEYRARLENVSNSWMVATVSTLDRQSRDVLAGVAQAAEEKLRETFALAFASVGEALRVRLQEIAAAFPTTNPNAKAAGTGR